MHYFYLFVLVVNMPHRQILTVDCRYDTAVFFLSLSDFGSKVRNAAITKKTLSKDIFLYMETQPIIAHCNASLQSLRYPRCSYVLPFSSACFPMYTPARGRLLPNGRDDKIVRGRVLCSTLIINLLSSTY
jgi:hypothetical protein